MSGRVIVIAQARTGSSRLPGKVLREAGGKSLLWHLASRLRRAETPSALVLATTIDPSDTALAEVAVGLGLQVHRGSIEDVLARFFDALEALRADDDDVVVRVTGDCPLLDPEELDRLVFEFKDREGRPNQVDYLTNQAGDERTIPRGLDVEVFWAGALRRAHRETDAPGDREHVTPFLYREGGGGFRTAVSPPDRRDLSHLRLTVDEAADLEVIDAVVRALGPDAGTLAVAAWLDAHPEIRAINAETRQKSLQSEGELRSERIDRGMLLARADAGAGIGFGHVARVTALVDAWSQLGGRAAVVGHGITGSALRRLQALGANVVHGGDKAFEGRAASASALVVDGYAFTSDDHRRWAALGPPLVAIDDLAEFAPVADVVVNQNLDFDVARYGQAGGSRLLVGSPYVLLRSEFRERRVGGTARRRVLMTFGGSDPARLTLPMVRAMVARTPQDVALDVVVGGGLRGPDRSALDRLAELQSRVTLHIDVRDMAALMRRATVAMSAAGGTVWELMTCGVPVALVAVAANQQVVVDGVSRRDAGVSLGWHADLDPHAAADRVAALLRDDGRRAELARRGRELVDGRGVLRVIDALLDAVESRRQD